MPHDVDPPEIDPPALDPPVIDPPASDPYGTCPVPISEYPAVLLAHGGGGSLTQMLIDRMLQPTFSNAALDQLHDGAVVDVDGRRLAVSTDSFVISPLFFPGGDIGSLAVHGTVNDVAMCGAQPLWMSVALVLEEGFPMDDLWRVVASMHRASATAGTPIVTGDTKVVDRGKGDGVYITTTGIGLVPEGVEIAPERAEPGDVVIVNGGLAEHGMAIMSVREGLEFETTLQSDSAPLNGLVAAIVAAGGRDVHVLRDLTRGGLASAANEIARSAGVGIGLTESAIPIHAEVRGACEILGFDPLYVANEGKCIAIVAPAVADDVLAAMRGHPNGVEAAIIGEVTDERPGRVVMRSSVGGSRIVDMLSGEQLPRIC